ncbi:MAG: biopolymer transporter ExbD [Lentisphaeria bacterium]|nr:biopolymer transporter ExbD [Lentisphaeria bacterium]
MNLNKKTEGDAKVELQIAPLIDVVFLLLIYFLVTASLVKKEADISFILPAQVTSPVTDFPVEALIMIAPDGTVELDGLEFPPEDSMLNELVSQLNGLGEIAATQTTMPLVVTITPSSDAVHLRIVDVMDACASAKVTTLSFGKSL